MPIVGLSDRGEDFPVIGKIRKGSPKRKNKDGKEIFGLELPHFRVEWAEGETDAQAKFESIYGTTPKAIRVLFPFNEITRIWDPWKTAFTAGTMLGRSDGKFINYLQTIKGEVIVRNGLDKDGNRVPHPENNVAGADFNGRPVEFHNSGILKVLVLELPRAAYMEVITNSTHDIANISGQLAAFKTLNGGQFAGIPFVIKRVPKMISTPGDKGGPRVRRKKYLISIEVDPAWVERMFGKLKVIALPEYGGPGVELAALPAGDKTPYDPDDDEIWDGTESEEADPEPAEAAGASPAPAADGLPEKKMVYPLGKEAVEFAANAWGLDFNQAMKELQKKDLGKLIAWDDLKEIVSPSPSE